VNKSRQAAELGISLMNALWAVKGMVPSAVAIAPALLRGSLTVKTLVPQSSIPGMFIILLPWLYCPLVWCIYVSERAEGVGGGRTGPGLRPRLPLTHPPAHPRTSLSSSSGP
jgi:hypothetical protein